MVRGPDCDEEDSMLSEAEKAYLEHAIYHQALAEAREPDTPRNRSIAASDYWQFLQAGGGPDREAIAALARGLRACESG
jgi:hypothetical protein